MAAEGAFNHSHSLSFFFCSFQNGIDVIWETIGGAVFETLFSHLALGGRLVIVGAISGYKTVGFPPIQIDNLATKVSDVVVPLFVLVISFCAKTILNP